MDNVLGSNLRKLRTERGLSLDETSKLTGVSKAMLGQVERGESSPTVSTLWKIAAGLKVTFSSLMAAAPKVYASHSLKEFPHKSNRMDLENINLFLVPSH